MSKPMKHLRPADDRDWRIFYGQPAPLYWSGLVLEDPVMILGIGGLYASEDGRWWAFMKRAPGVGCVFSAQRAAMHMMAVGKEAGLTIHALADPAIVGSDKWLQRLGFRRTDEIMKGLVTWTLLPSRQ